jgi:hypothetical protein
MRALDERECYARLHGHRNGQVVVIAASAVPGRPSEDAGLRRTGPALDLLFAYPRARARMTGEEIRLDLLRRMQARSAA